MYRLLPRLEAAADFTELLESMGSSPRRIAAHGVPRAARGFWLAALAHRLRRPVVAIVSTQQEAEQLLSDVDAVLGNGEEAQVPENGRNDSESEFRIEVATFPQTEVVLDIGTAVDLSATRQRLSVLDLLLTERPCVVVTTIGALCAFTIPPDDYLDARFELRVKQQITISALTESLLDAGYERTSAVQRVGEFSVRGGIVDVYPGAAPGPYRIEFFDDEIESLRQFDLSTQRSRQAVEEIVVTAARETLIHKHRVAAALPRMRDAMIQQAEILERGGGEADARTLRQIVTRDIERMQDGVYFDTLDKYQPFLYPEQTTFLDYLPRQAVIVSCEPETYAAQHEQTAAEIDALFSSTVAQGELLPPPGDHILPLDKARDALSGLSQIEVYTTPADTAAHRENIPRIDFSFQLVQVFHGQLQAAAATVHNWLTEKTEVVIATEHPDRLAALLREQGIGAVRADISAHYEPLQEVLVVPHRLQSGFIAGRAQIAVVTDAEIFGWQGSRRKWRKRNIDNAVAVSSIAELHEGDFVVHINHGIGVYRGLVTQEVAGVAGEYVYIQYAGSDKLYVPTSQMDRIQKFVGAEDQAPPLSTLGGAKWNKQKQRAREAAEEIADELAALYAARQTAEGFTFSPDLPWQREMESSFEWEETESQERAIADVKGDMEGPRPMDRLVCGDVGFGKTEVAIRAAFKAVLDGKQVAVLAPTTVLAQQHYQTFRSRLQAYPTRIEVLSRFKTSAEQRAIVGSVSTGSVDIIVGTHRLLQKDVEFHDLGLLVIDEEQRFGVKDKERIRQLKTSVDVMTLTATPIPRTLQMGLAGLRDMSVIDDPPKGRIPIKTFSSKYDDDLLRRAILREMERGGQVYYLHNRVQSIMHVAEHIRTLIPHARVLVGHGQLRDDELEEVMLKFLRDEADVLVCTTIIENGIDLPNVNTIIVDNSERLGLAQLYQLRGRVGRSDRQAYCYFLTGRRGKLTRSADQRLQAIQEYTDLGSGFKIAVRDLEIRGAGNLLGAQQHGHMQAVGFELYCQMLEDAVAAVKNEPPPQRRTWPEIELPLPTFLPEDYVEDLTQRLQFYRRMSNVQKADDVDQIRGELRDRFGRLPQPAANAMRVLKLRVLAADANITSIAQQKNELVILFRSKYGLSNEALRNLYNELARRHPTSELNAVRARDDGLAIDTETFNDQRLLRLLEEVIAVLVAYRTRPAPTVSSPAPAAATTNITT